MKERVCLAAYILSSDDDDELSMLDKLRYDDGRSVREIGYKISLLFLDDDIKTNSALYSFAISEIVKKTTEGLDKNIRLLLVEEYLDIFDETTRLAIKHVLHKKYAASYEKGLELIGR